MRTRRAGLALLTLLLAWPAAADELAQNGDVLVGDAARGESLGTTVPDERLLVVIDSPYQVFDDTGTFIHVAAWTPDGRPAERAEVYLSGHLVGRTDAHGTLVFRWGVPGSDVESYWLSGSTVSVRWVHDDKTWGGDVWFNAFSRTTSFASDHLFVYTDRGVYNPGQTIRTRLVGWHLAADYSPLGADGGAEVELLLTAPDGRPVAGGRAVADTFGVAALDLALPARAEEGMYELVASYNGARATQRLRIERFVAPVIDIRHTLGRFLTRDQESLAFEVELGYFAGGEFEAGTIAVDVLVNDASRWHRETDVAGSGPHAFALDEDALDELRDDLVEDQRIEVQIAVTDAYGRHDDLHRELHYTANPYIAIIERDRDYYSTGDPVELVVRLTDRERVPVRGRDVRLEADCASDMTAVTDERGTVQFSLVMPEGACTVSAFLDDVDVPLATTWLTWQVRQPMRSHIGDAIVQEGEPVSVSISFPADFVPAEEVVHLDVVDTSGSLVNAVLVPIRREGETWLAEGTFTAPSWGSMLLTMFCLGHAAGVVVDAGGETTNLGLMTEGQNLAVHPGRELVIHLDGVPDELAPGSDLRGRIRVTNAAGEPVEASVGAALVDMAVISLKDPLEITPMDHFYNPELRVMSTTGSAILTWPVVSRNWGAHMMDIALPPFPWKEGGAIAQTGHSPYGGPGSLAGGWDSDGTVYWADETESGVELEETLAPMATLMAPAPPPMLDPSPDEPMAAGDYRRRTRELEAPPEPVVITIRTEFPETSLWEPRMTTDAAGSVPLSGRVPDSITRQQLTLVASDAHGGVGVLRADVQVTQPLFVRADLPDALTVGDRVDARVAVQNLTDTDEVVEVVLSGPFVAGEGAAELVDVPAHGVGVAVFPIEPTAAGTARYVASARTALLQDIEERDVWVRPAGTPHVTTVDRTVTRDVAFRETVTIPDAGQMTEVTLNVAFPAIGSAFAGLDALRAELEGGDTMALGGEIIATALLYDYQRRAGVPEAELAPLRTELQRVAFELAAAQRADGGWGFWWDAESNPYVTGYALEALLALRDADVAVDNLRFVRAIDYLAMTRIGNGWEMTAIAFWEGDNDAVRLGLAAELFDVLSRVPEPLQTGSWPRMMMELSGFFREVIDSETPEPLAMAHAVMGLSRLREAGVVELDAARLSAAARRLVTLRREGHWEPSWFNAYGGTIEATVAVLEVLQTVDVEISSADMRDTVRYLLSTRDEWGGWHNPRGTAAAIRGLLLIAPSGPEVASTVRVRVDGREVAAVPVDPADPFLSALELRALDLSGVVDAGGHAVEVVYDGNLELETRLSVRRWDDAPAGGQAWVQVETALSAERIEVGQPVDYRVTVRSQSGAPRLVQLDLAAPANASLDRTSVDALRQAGLVQGVEWTGGGLRLFVQLAAHSERDLDLRWFAERGGAAAVPAPTVRILVGPGDDAGGVAVGEPLALVVE